MIGVGRDTKGLKCVLRRAGHFLSFLFGGGSWSLRPHEQAVLQAATQYLATEIAERVRAQLEQGFFVERTRRISVLRFYNIDDALRIADSAFEDRLLKVRIAIDGRDQTAHVTFYKGQVLSLEFQQPANFYAGKALAVCGVSEGSSKESYTIAIDRQEHGKEDEA